MNALADVLQRIAKGGNLLGGIFLIIAMLIHVTNIFGRVFKFVITGSMETFELIMVFPIGFGLVYAALKGYHVTVDLIVSRFPPKLRAISEMVSSVLCLIIWALIAWASTSMAMESGWEEVSETLNLPYLPFRMVWIFCLILFCLAYVVDFFRATRRLMNQ